jgi:hydrogenase small subunit
MVDSIMGIDENAVRSGDSSITYDDACRTLLWLEAGSCSGETMAILGASARGKEGQTLSGFLRETGFRLLWHPSLSHETPTDAGEIFAQILSGAVPLSILCVEGSILHGPDGTGAYDRILGRAKRDVIRELAGHADFVLAMGTCASFGGIPAAAPNPTEATGLQLTQGSPGGLLPPEWRSRAGLPVINLAGCPVDADTMIETQRAVAAGTIPQLDAFNRPATVRPCLSDGARRCGTAHQVGYACYGCIATRFPAPKLLFRHVPEPVARAVEPRR